MRHNDFKNLVARVAKVVAGSRNKAKHFAAKKEKKKEFTMLDLCIHSC